MEHQASKGYEVQAGHGLRLQNPFSIWLERQNRPRLVTGVFSDLLSLRSILFPPPVGFLVVARVCNAMVLTRLPHAFVRLAKFRWQKDADLCSGGIAHANSKISEKYSDFSTA